MAHLQYFSYKGFGERSLEQVHYNQAVRVGDHIHVSGQGGWDRLTEAIPPTLEAQIAQAFDNIEHTLQLSGSKGWSEVYSVRCYTTKVEEEELGLIAKYLKQYCPDHAPILTGVVVGGLFEGMLVEIEVSAHVRGE